MLSFKNVFKDNVQLIFYGCYVKYKANFSAKF
jgi:hypothetical protein